MDWTTLFMLMFLLQDDEKWTVLEPSVQTHLYFKEKDAGEQEEMTEIGAYIIAPGQGILVSSWKEGKRVVEQSQTNKWWRRSDPWVERNYKTNKHPHKKLKPGQKCTVCNG